MTTKLARRDFLRAASAGALSSALYGAPARAAEAPANLTIDEYVRDLAANAPLAMQFRGGTADECRAWQAEFGGKLRELMGPTEPPATWESILERTVEQSDHTREERILVAEGLAPVPYHLLVPSNATGKRPCILAVHGHGDFGHESISGVDDTPERRAEVERYKYDYGRQLVRRGYLVACPCLAPFGRRRDPKTSRSVACDMIYLRLAACGKLLLSENVRDVRWTLDAMLAHELADAERIGCVGLSYGGRTTTFTTALEPRIRVAVISGALNCLQERAINKSTAGCQMVPHLLEYGDVPEIGSLIAPRPVVWEVGSQDRLMVPAWCAIARERMERAYKALEAEQALAFDHFEGGHMWHGAVAYPALEKAFA